MTKIIIVRCLECNRFMGETADYGRFVCSECGSEVTYRSKDYRRIERTTLNTPERAVLSST